MIAEYATLQKSTHRINPVKWEIRWDKTKSDADGYTILYIEFIHKPTRIRRYQSVSMRFISDSRELEQRLEDLCDKYYYEITKELKKNE
jgi:hypothetical protein